MKKLVPRVCVGLFLAFTLSAQEVPRFNFNLGAGFTSAVGGTSRRLDTGWNVDAGAGYNFNSVLGAALQYNFNDFGINSSTLTNIGVPDGSVRIWSLTLNPIVHLNPHRGPADVYL